MVCVREDDLSITMEGININVSTIDEVLEMFKGVLQAWGYCIRPDDTIVMYSAKADCDGPTNGAIE